MKGAMSTTMEPPSDERLVVHALAHKITLKQFSLEKNACENSVLEKWAVKPSATDPTRTRDEAWLNWKVYALLWSRLFGNTLGQFPFEEPVEGRPLGYAEMGAHAAETVRAVETVSAVESVPAETTPTAETIQAETAAHIGSTSTTSNIKSQTDVEGPRPTAPRQSSTRKAQPQKPFTIPADIQKRPAVLDLDSDEMPQYSAIFPASITRYIFSKVEAVDGKAQVEVFHQYYKNCSINASLDQKRRIVTVWSEPRGYTGTLTEEIEKELAESAIFLAAYSNEAWKKDTAQGVGPPMAAFFATWLKEKAKVQFGHDKTQSVAADDKQREIRIEYHEGTKQELTRWWVAPAVPMNMATGEAVLVNPAEIAIRGPLTEGESALIIAKKENDRRRRIAAYERKVRMFDGKFMGTPAVNFDELDKEVNGLSGVVPTIQAKIMDDANNTHGDADLISLSPEHAPEPIVTKADLDRKALANSSEKLRKLLADLEAERDQKQEVVTEKLKAGIELSPEDTLKPLVTMADINRLTNPSERVRKLLAGLEAETDEKAVTEKIKVEIDLSSEDAPKPVVTKADLDKEAWANISEKIRNLLDVRTAEQMKAGINLSPEEAPKPVVTTAGLDRATLTNLNGNPLNLVAHAEKKAAAAKTRADIDRRFAELKKMKAKREEAQAAMQQSSFSG